MPGRARRMLGTASGAGVGLLVALVGAGSSEQTAGGAGPAPTDAGVSSTFVTHAQRGEVQPPDLDDVEHMCALLTSCEKLPIPPGLIPPDFPTCVKSMHDEMTSAKAVSFSLLMRECGLQSNSCASLATCALRGARPDACSGRGKQALVGFCDVDGRAISCWHEQILAVRDCPRGHEECLVMSGDARCSLGPCPGDMRDGDKARCSASQTHLLHCEKGKLATLDCAAFGLKCVTAADGTAGCATSGPVCAGSTRRCEGTTAVGCFNGHEVRVDCAAAGLVCEPTPGGTPIGACVAPPAPTGGCDPNDKARCDGASIRYCYAGKPRSYFCKAFGFGRCETGKTGAHCAR
jgi:hypothetical protein